MNSCRICLSTTRALCPLFRYKLSGNYAEMLTAIADVKVVSKDGLPDKICTKCCTSLEKAYLLKTIAERSDRKLRELLLKNNVTTTKKIAFDSFTDVKSEIGSLAVKNEPKWDVEIELLDVNKPIETVDGKDIVIANTVIRKVDGTNEENKPEILDNKIDLTWESLQSNTNVIITKQETTEQSQDEQEYLDDDIYQDDDDDDYVPPQEKQKKKPFKKPKLSDIKVFKDRVPALSNVKVLKKIKSRISKDYDNNPFHIKENNEGRKSTIVTCYPILKNGSRGPAILLKRPKDANKVCIPAKPEGRALRPAKQVRVVRNIKPAPKQREKLVCPVCGILTFTLGNHMATHQEKKKYTCSQCPRSFVQKSNLQVHMKQHAGIKDHICEVCGAGFYSQKSLVRHNLIHKGDRPFACTLCTKRFIARCDLNRHMRIHSGYKPFKCGTCAMSFNAKHQLQNHERMHTGERPFTCQVCNVAFSYKVNLNNHVFKVHGINLKFKSIHTVTEEVLRREMGIANEARVAISQILPQLNDVPTPGAHETVHNTTDY